MSSESNVEQHRQTMYRWVILCVGILAYGTSQFSRSNFTGIQKFVAADLQLDKGALGLLASVFFYSYAFFQMPWGVASDRFGSRWVIGLGILPTGLATLMVYRIMRSVGVSFVAYSNYLVPVYALGFGALTLGETLDWNVALGLALIIAGIAATRFVPSRRKGQT